MTLPEVFDCTLENWGGHPVFMEIRPGISERILNADEFRRRVDDTADELSRFGVRMRCAVPLFLDNSIDFPVIFLALLKLQAVPVLVKTDYRSMELAEIFGNLNPDIVICKPEHVVHIAPWLDEVLVIGLESGLLRPLQNRDDPPGRIDVDDDVATINYTYRGYGYPLGAMVTHGQYLHGAQIVQIGMQSRPGQKMLGIVPFAHIFTLIGCLVLPLRHRVSSLIPLTLNPRSLFSIIRSHSVEFLLSVPEVIGLLHRVGSAPEDFRSLQAFLTGGSRMTAEEHREYSRYFDVEIYHGYGLTEFTPVAGNQTGTTRAGTVGPIGVDLEYRNHRGEIQVKSPDISRGYYRRESESAEVWEDGFFRTGDSGHIEDGHLVFDREIKRTRKINGNIVDLTEVENAISSSGYVDRFELIHDQGSLTAFVSLKAGDNSRLEGLRRHLRDQIAGYKIPKLIPGDPDGRSLGD